MTPEGKIEAYLKKQVKANGGHFRKVKWIGRRGCPDRLVWWRAPGAWIEVKRPGVKAENYQLREHERLRKDGWAVYVVDSKLGVDFVLSLLMQP